MKSKILLLVSGLIIVGNLLSQNPGQEYTDRMNYIFQHVNKSRVTTGLLSDYGLYMVEPDVFDGIPADSNYVDMDTWKILYSGMYSSKINNNVSLTLPETVFTLIDSAIHTTAVPVAMMHYQYNQLNENAVTQNLLQIVNEQIIEVPNAASPYLTKQLFAVAPKELYFTGGTVSFIFKSDLWYQNVNKTIQKCEINFNNESGYLLANWNVPVNYTFGGGGLKTIYFRLTYTDGTSYTSQTNISVTTSTILKSTSGYMSDIPWAKTAQHSGGTIQVWLSPYNYSGQIKKPLIVAEGFDPFNSTDIYDFLRFSSSPNSFGTINCPYPGGGTLKNKIDFAQFDIIYLDYKDGMDDIWRNAQLFKEVIQWVNGQKQGSEPNVVMGISMGGLVARIALRQLENEGYNHQTKKYISVDSPHKGANVPIGLQAAVRHIQNVELWVWFIKVFDYKSVEGAKLAVNLLNSTAAKQMLIYTINKNYSLDNSVHNTFQQTYDQLGFPQQCENITISNGANNGSLTFAAGSAIVDYQDSYSLKWWTNFLSGLNLLALLTNYPQVAWNAIPGSSQVKVEINVDALKNQTASRVYKGKVYIRKKILWLIPVNINIEDKTVNSTAGMLPIDGAPGGLYSLEMLGGGSLPIPTSAIKQTQFCFIPTVSSLALSDWSTKLTQNLTNVTTSPFHSIYTQGNNQLHTQFTSSASFLYNHLDLVIIGSNMVSSPSSYNLNTNQIATWSVSSGFSITPTNGGASATVTASTTAAINGQIGTITAVINGIRTVTKSIQACFGGPEIVNLQNETETGTETYYASEQIIAGGNYTIESGANVTFSSGSSITLSPGFHAKAGSNFRAYIEPYFTCTYSLKAAILENNEEYDEQIPVIENYTVEKTEPLKSEEETEEKTILINEFYLKLYPNPSVGDVIIEYQISKSEFVEISLYDSYGKLVYRLKNNYPHDSGVYKVTLNGVEFPKGFYICTLQTENKYATEKLIVK